jgi:hypothetical protein
VIGRIHPADQFSLIIETVERLASFAAAESGPTVWVTSLYAPLQFSGGDMGHPLAHLCTDPSNADCAWDPRLVPPVDALVVTKTDLDAGFSLAFVDVTTRLAQLRAGGVVVCDAPDAWRSELTDR